MKREFINNMHCKRKQWEGERIKMGNIPFLELELERDELLF